MITVVMYTIVIVEENGMIIRNAIFVISIGNGNLAGHVVMCSVVKL